MLTLLYYNYILLLVDEVVLRVFTSWSIYSDHETFEANESAHEIINTDPQVSFYHRNCLITFGICLVAFRGLALAS